MRNTLFWILFLFILPLQAQQKLPYLQKQGSTTQLMVDGKPFLVIGGELGNSSASSIEDIERIFPKLQRMGLNTVLVPTYWDLTEPQEGKFDFTLTDAEMAAMNALTKKNIRVGDDPLTYRFKLLAQLKEEGLV